MNIVLMRALIPIVASVSLGTISLYLIRDYPPSPEVNLKNIPVSEVPNAYQRWQVNEVVPSNTSCAQARDIAVCFF